MIDLISVDKKIAEINQYTLSTIRSVQDMENVSDGLKITSIQRAISKSQREIDNLFLPSIDIANEGT